MKKALVGYYSRTGNTAKMAEMISASLTENGISVDRKEMTEIKAEELAGYDILVFGSPTYYGTMSFEVKRLLDESVKLHGKLDGRIGAAFASSANIAGGNETTVLDILHAFLVHGMLIQGDPKGSHYGPVAVGLPDDRAVEECRRFGNRLAVLAGRVENQSR